MTEAVTISVIKREVKGCLFCFSVLCVNIETEARL